MDTDENKVNLIQRGKSDIQNVASEKITKVRKTNRLSASIDFAKINDADGVIICVPSPLKKNREPDISFILETGRMIAPHLSKGTLVSLESTTALLIPLVTAYVGTNDSDFMPDDRVRIVFDEAVRKDQGGKRCVLLPEQLRIKSLLTLT